MQTHSFLPDGMSPIPENRRDGRTDREIAHMLCDYVPPTDSNKNVWAYWRSGFESMPPWTKRNVMNWVRLLHCSPAGRDPWTVRVLDSVPGSPNNVSRFIDKSLLPASFQEQDMAGPYAGAHSADLVRLPLLHRYGGVWIDVGTLLIRHLDDVWSIITDPANPFELLGMALALRPGEEILVNPFLATTRGNEFLRRWHQIYLALWDQGGRSCDGFHANPLLRHLPLFQPPAGRGVPGIGKSPERYTDYLAHMLCGVRLRDLIDADDGFDGRLYYERHVCLLPALRELYYFPLRNGWDGRREFDVLATRMDRTDEEARHARKLVRDTLQNSCMIKFSHGSRGSSTPWLAQLWTDPRNCDADVAPGTLAEYLRLVALQAYQDRPLQPLPTRSLTTPTWTARLLEPLPMARELR
ncbi:capsule polysaccharide biosynthesis protein [Diplodia corticola]|uniref:Capsule polysaccharide biosynthesis protein n=1 Tax=Diplodia corticola TaxID=236234 RepID=A0A1J9RMA3_9PEZI|nr:capsule polysaccharide biosynthesis protein [Diplodia corticola]OJD33707.1 capsule polysaccharide biosynthesis protein [Diplodia corticola]